MSANLMNVQSYKNEINRSIRDSKDVQKLFNDKKRLGQYLKMARVLDSSVIVFVALHSCGD